METHLAALEFRIIVIAVVASMSVGGVWHGLFFRPSAREFRPNARASRRSSSRMSGFLIFLLADLVTATLLAWLTVRLELRGAAAGALLGSVAWIGLVAPTGLAHRATHGGSPADWVVDGFGQWLSLLTMGTILGAWTPMN